MVQMNTKSDFADAAQCVAWPDGFSSEDSHALEIVPNDATLRLSVLCDNLLDAARSYFEATGTHLPVYRQIARLYASAHCDVPLDIETSKTPVKVELAYLAPDVSDETIRVDVVKPFATLVVVRIFDDFTCEARMAPRDTFAQSDAGVSEIRWSDLPHGFTC